MSGHIIPRVAALAAALSDFGEGLVAGLEPYEPLKKGLDDLGRQMSLAALEAQNLQLARIEVFEGGPPSHKCPNHVAFQHNPTRARK